MSINWYPGHMVKARREIEENIKLVDIAVILLDARAPFSCRNQDLEKIARNTKMIFVLNKRDLAYPAMTRRYAASLKKQGYLVAAMDSTNGKGAGEVLELINQAYQERAEAMKVKGRRVRAARVMVMGVPNIGKSTFLNCLVGKKMARTGAKPGITRGKQWIRVREDIEFLDTPGLMWPKISVEEQGLKLALLSIVGEKSYSEYDVSLYLIRLLKEKSPQTLKDKFKLDDLDQADEEILNRIARGRGHLLKGGNLDLDKTCTSLIQDFRKGNLGRISLD
ncbi:MAG: ribosome biogenesis GTPase YlqF [Syntrophomonadaceae bacterium]|nr:ribosome biogenesis GTPase YlqF [Syntrophomonadaceae bacterium]MDD3022657.1 ribosome biogenesis GTPase YlqF [Syntrophomonadaceae bacterium]